jgi:O-antigen/teichoic acid export membrane protein
MDLGSSTHTINVAAGPVLALGRQQRRPGRVFSSVHETRPAISAGLAALPQDRVRSAASDAAVLTVATYCAQALVFGAGLVQKGLLGPVGTGFWSLMQTAWVFLAIAPLGVMHGSTRQIPLRRGRGDFAAAGAAAATGSSFSLLAVGVAGALLAGVAAVFGDGWAPELRYGLVLAGVIAPLRLLCDCHEVILQAVKRFDMAALSTVLEAAVMATLGTVLVWWLGYYGLFAAVVAACLARLALWWWNGLTGWRRPAFAWRIERPVVRELLGFGAPIMIQGQIWLLFLTVDNLIVAGFLGVRNLGYYALAVSVSSYVLLLPRSIGAALFPRMTERFGQAGDVRSIHHYATDVQRLLAYLLLPVLAGAAFYAVPVLVRQALPEFTPAISAVQIMVAGSFVVALMNMPTKVLITAGHRWPLVALMLGCLAFNAAANWVALGPLGRGIEGAALATSLSYLVTFVALTAFALGKALPPAQVAGHVSRLLAVFGYAIAALWGIDALLGAGGGTPAADAAMGAAKLLVFLAVMAPWAVVTERRYGTLSRIGALARDAARRLPGVRA